MDFRFLILLSVPVAMVTLSEGSSFECICTPECETSWHLFEGNCYRFFSEKKEQAEARAECAGFQADLVSIHSQDENDFVVQLTDQETWTGLTDGDGALEGVYVWTDGSSMDIDVIPWAAGSPNNYQGQDCGGFDGTHIGYWNDYDCDANDRPFVCKKAAV